jgi:chemotaxis protein methyltransferase CheR
MKNTECTEFLQRFLPRLRLRWPGYRKVHSQVCKHLNNRINELGLSDLNAYEHYLDGHVEEWSILDSLCWITISHFYRDRSAFDTLRSKILPILAEQVLKQGVRELRCWCAGCCSGEEAYTLQILWNISVIPALGQDLPLYIIATDVDKSLLERAQRGSYRHSSIQALPKEFIDRAFDLAGDVYTIRKLFTENIEFVHQDIREQMPGGPFDLILCRNLVFTYFEEALQQEILKKIVKELVPGGILVIGIHESIPQGWGAVTQYGDSRCVYQKTTADNERSAKHEITEPGQQPSQAASTIHRSGTCSAVTGNRNRRTRAGA